MDFACLCEILLWIKKVLITSLNLPIIHWSKSENKAKETNQHVPS